MGRVDTADQYMATDCFLQRTLKWWRKLFFWGNVSIIHAYVLYVESRKKNNSNPMSHTKFRQQLAMAFVGSFCHGGDASSRKQHSTPHKEHRLNRQLQVIIQHSERKHKECSVFQKKCAW
jgi:hypothetical protein